MSIKKALRFNQKAAAPNSKPDQVVEALNVLPGQNIADIGAGGGYYVLRFAKLVGPAGKVYALDVNKEFLEYINESARLENLGNVVTVPITDEELNLPAKGLDLIFMRNVTHHIPQRQTYFSRLKQFLKPEGKIAIIEYKKGRSFTFHGLFKHYVAKETIVREMENAGYRLVEDYSFLPQQHFTVYEIKT